MLGIVTNNTANGGRSISVPLRKEDKLNDACNNLLRCFASKIVEFELANLIALHN